MGPLEFSAGSHVVSEGRALAISDESEKQIISEYYQRCFGEDILAQDKKKPE